MALRNNGLDELLGDGDFTDSWSARDYGDDPVEPGGVMGAIVDAASFKPARTATVGNTGAVVSAGSTGAGASSGSSGGSSGGVAVGTPVVGTQAQPTLPTDDPNLPLPETGYRENGNVYVRDERGNAVQVFPINGNWSTRGGVAARYITAYVQARAQGQTANDAVRTAAAAANYYVPSIAELQAAGQATNNSLAVAAPLVNAIQQSAGATVAALAPSLNLLTQNAVQQGYAVQATAEHRDIMARYQFQQAVMNGINELLNITRGFANGGVAPLRY